jgi:pyruvate dehydrogenase (quinone)
MANAMAQAIGAQATFPGRQVISLSGDGGFSMLMGDFLTLAQHNLPVKVVVFNNGTLGFVEIEQNSTGFLDFGVSLKNPNFAAMVEAVGVRGIRLEDPGEVENGIAAALAHDGPVLVDAVVSRMVLSIPPSITVEMAKGFTLYMVKAVMSGRGDDLIDRAEIFPLNFFNFSLRRNQCHRLSVPARTVASHCPRAFVLMLGFVQSPDAWKAWHLSID